MSEEDVRELQALVDRLQERLDVLSSRLTETQESFSAQKQQCMELIASLQNALLDVSPRISRMEEDLKLLQLGLLGEPPDWTMRDR